MKQIAFVSVIIAFLIPNTLGGSKSELAMQALTTYIIKSQTNTAEIDLEEESDDATVGDVSIFTNGYAEYLATGDIDVYPNVVRICVPEHKLYTVCGNANKLDSPILIFKMNNQTLDIKEIPETMSLKGSTKPTDKLDEQEGKVTEEVMGFLIKNNFYLEYENERHAWLAKVDMVGFGLYFYNKNGVNYYMVTIRLGPFRMTKFAADLFRHWGNSGMPITVPKGRDVYAISIPEMGGQEMDAKFINTKDKNFIMVVQGAKEPRTAYGIYSPTDICRLRSLAIESAFKYAEVAWQISRIPEPKVGVIKYVSDDGQLYHLVAMSVLPNQQENKKPWTSRLF